MGKMKRKGIFFTFISIVIVAVFLLVLTPQADITLQKDTQAVRTKINTIDNYIESIEDSYLTTALKSSTFKTMLSLAYYMNTTGKFMTNLDPAFSEIIINGTLNKVPVDSLTGKKIMDNNTLANWSLRIANVGKDTYNAETNITIINTSVTQTDPWRLTSILTVNISVKSSISDWKISKTIVATTSLEGLYDPYYLVNTVSMPSYGKRIRQSNVPFDKWNISQVRITLENSTYVYWKNTKAPSYLMRFVNNTNGSGCCGIESFVDPNRISPSDQRGSYIDYAFWSYEYGHPDNCTKLFNITNPATGGGIWDEFKYFKMDFSHLILYNVTSQDAVRNC